MLNKQCLTSVRCVIVKFRMLSCKVKRLLVGSEIEIQPRLQPGAPEC